MHDLKFSNLLPVPSWLRLAKRTYKSEICTEAARIFSINVQLVLTLAMVPGYAFMNGEDWGFSVVRAMRELGCNDPDDKSVQSLASKIWDEYDKGGFDESRIKHFLEATDNAIKMASLPGRAMSHGALHGLLRSMVTHAWTAFEVLAEDLHSGVRQKHPECFPSNLLSKKYGFRRLESMCGSYETLFWDDAKVKAVARSTEIKSIALLRHLLVHKNGVVDQMFLDQCSQNPVVTRFAAFELGDEVLINGEMVRNLVEPVTNRGYELVQLVDQWIIAHKS